MSGDQIYDMRGHYDGLSKECASKDAELSALRERLAEVERQRDHYRFEPQGDNHHNALKCPYCNPGLVDWEARAEAAEEANKRLREALDHSVSQLDAIIEDGTQTDFRAWRDDLRRSLADAHTGKQGETG